MATSDPFANPAWEGNSRIPTHPAPAAAQSWQSSVGRSSAEEKAIESGAPYTAPTYVATGTTAPKPGLKERFDGIMPPNRRYLGRSRRTVLLGALGLLALLILALGLGLGLGLKKKGGDSFVIPRGFIRIYGIMANMKQRGTAASWKRNTAYGRSDLLLPRPGIRELRLREHVRRPYLRRLASPVRRGFGIRESE